MNPLKLSKRDYKRFVRHQTMYEGADGDYIRLKHADTSGNHYETSIEPYVFYWFNRKTITVPGLFRTDGATMVQDLVALAWHIHDYICKVPYWDDGTPISNLRASWIYRSILRWHGKKVRSKIRFIGTFLFGGKEIKKQVGWV